MATEIGPPAPPVADADLPLDQAVRRAGYRFDFFQIVRLFERMHDAARTAGTPSSHVPIGHNDHPFDEVIRIREHHSLSFPPSQVFEITQPEDDDPDPRPIVWINFLGLCGVSGPMPRHYAQLLAEAGVRDPTDAGEALDVFRARLTTRQTAALRAFLDIFTHRLGSLFYRAWEKYRFPIAYERGGTDTFSRYLYCLIGLGTKGLRGRLNIDDQILIYYTGLLAQRPRSAIALEGLLEDYFGVRIEVVQFQGQWFEMNADLLSSLGTNGQNNRLGDTAVLWERIRDPQARFRINVGPLGYREFKDFMPGSPGYVHLVELARFFVGEDVNFEVRPMLRREEVPYCMLQGDESVRLGWSMWLKEAEFEDDVPQPVFGARLASG